MLSDPYDLHMDVRTVKTYTVSSITGLLAVN